MVREQSSSSSPSSSPCLSYGNHFKFRRLFQKTIEGFDFKINGRALGRRSLAGLDGRAQTQGVWTVFPSLLQSLRAATGMLEENMLHSCDTDLFQESKSFKCFVNFDSEEQIFYVKWNFDGIGNNLLPSKAALIASLNLSIIHWCLSSESNPVQSSKSE